MPARYSPRNCNSVQQPQLREAHGLMYKVQCISKNIIKILSDGSCHVSEVIIKGLNTHMHTHTTFIFLLVDQYQLVIVSFTTGPRFIIRFCHFLKSIKNFLCSMNSETTSCLNYCLKSFFFSTKSATPVREIDFPRILQSNSVWTLLQTKAVIMSQHLQNHSLE